MSGSASLSELVSKVVDFISKVLVLTTESIGGVVGFFQLSLESVEFSRVTSGFLLGILELALEIIALGLPFTNGLVESALFLLKVVGVGLALLLKKFLVIISNALRKDTGN